MWVLFGLGDAPDTDVLTRLQAIEDEQMRFDRRFIKLQGEINAQLREQRRLERVNEELNEELDSLTDGGE